MKYPYFHAQSFVALALTALGISVAQAVPLYRVQALPAANSGDGFFNAVALNNRGDVAGYAADAQGSRSFVWTRGGFSYLPQAGASSLPVDINNRGQVLFNASGANGTTQPFLFNREGGVNISPAAGGAGFGRALSSNGLAVGDAGGRSFYFDGRDSRWLDWSLDGARAAFATGINRNCTIVGHALTSGDGSQAFIARNGRASFLDGLSDAWAINDRGQVLGLDGKGYLVRDADGSTAYLGFANATQLNARGWAVGSAVVDGALHTHVWRDGQSLDLNRLLAGTAATRWTLATAADINDRGQIIGIGWLNGVRTSFIATPVPEPQTWALLLGGVGLVGAAVRRRRGPDHAQPTSPR
ncbi:PEPxxWA-CTERM sorting domain-containing protein [Azohydromonas aeria]|uniref:PEPxxWA-CTERM sorting domain-containing protein n=1 Tax=Azohydromonas aeria TaxID=2590212 RepID=UPI0012FA1376|nr:PEPxxWA-CTERM sorting domain-containing protein [Azohydromonas aeria]